MNFTAMLKMPIGQSEFFIWGEALWCRNWQSHVIPSAEVERHIMETARRMDLIRNFFGVPLRVTSWLRPPAYNVLVRGAERSRHLTGQACDFIVYDVSADVARARLLPHLGDFNIRMENLPGSDWIHIDTACTENMPPALRYFKP